ncbi:MAG: PilN domain-containing protein [Burkholderiales bacterium]|nr:PilN domain-containing protein [Burkholderiales bacterium]
MYALDLDFRRPDHGTSWIGAALLAAALIGALASGGQYMKLADRIAAETAGIHDAAKATRKKTHTAASNADPQTLAAELKSANEILIRLTLPWGELFASAESAGTPDVALLAIESETDKRRVKISGEAKNLESILDYLRYLKSRPTLADVYLQSHDLQKQDTQQPVRFVVNAEWKLRK